VNSADPRRGSTRGPWQLFGLPVVTVAGMRDPAGMPLGLQLIGHPDHPDRLLRAAVWLERLMAEVTGPR
jgi:Asp-tRNA(Asn)/Glu-tRNA(Gln) amidotransferase A subunit family amidase